MSKKTMRIAVFAAIVAMLMAAFVPSLTASAAALDAVTKQTITVTEAQINATYRVTNPRNRAISNVYVAVQQDQVSITATITEPGKTPLNTVSVWQPYIVRGLVEWKIVSATSNGQPVSSDVLKLLETIHKYSLRTTFWNAVRRVLTPRSYVTAIKLTPGLITVTAEVYVRPTPKPPASP